MVRDGDDAQRPRLRWYNIVAPPAVLLFGIGVAVAAHRARPKPPPIETTNSPPVVGVESVQAYTDPLQIEVDGTVVPYREVAISAQVAGRIKRRTEECETGRAVEAGDLLIEIDAEDFDLAVERLEAELRQADASIAENETEIQNNQKLIELAEQDVQLQTRDVARLRSLLQERAASNSEMDESLRREVSARNALETLRNRTRTFEAKAKTLLESRQLVATRLRQAQLDLKRTRIESPIDGVVVAEHVEEDGYVQQGTALVTIEDTSAVEVRCMLRVDQMYWLWGHSTETDDRTMRRYELPRLRALVEYQIDGQTFVWEGELSRYDGIGLDPRTRTVPCRVVVDNPRDVRYEDQSTDTRVARPPALLRGMFVKVRLQVPPPGALIQIPRVALKPGRRVLRVDGNRVSIVPVRVAKMVNDRVILHANETRLRIDDQVVVSPLANVEDGMEVQTQGAAAVASLPIGEGDTTPLRESPEAPPSLE